MIEVFRCPICNTVIRDGAFISKCCVDFITKSNFKWSKLDELKEDIEKTEIQWSNIEDVTELPKTASDFLNAAQKHMKDRATTYDNEDGERSMLATVRAFSDITGICMPEEHGWLFMGVLKMVRSQQGDFKSDNYEDGAAYFALAGEAASKNR